MSNLSALLSRWRSEPSIGGNVVAWHTLPAGKAQLRALPAALPAALQQACAQRGYGQIYSHQAQAWTTAAQGKHLVVVTGTASGKTLCYNLPVLERLLRDPQARALYLFPTKALAQDQKEELGQWNEALPGAKQVPVATYDGDTSSSARPQTRREARIIISNPDMLHMGILPYHAKWAEFFANLQYIVIDEMHTYRGVFGSHVANVLRRLKRVMRFYGASPQFILTSATIANPIELAQWLTEEKVSLIAEDGSPHGPKHFLIYNPPIVDEKLGIRHSVLQESVRLVEDLLTYDVQTILFGKARRTVEVMLNYLREAPGGDAKKVRGYRGGYLPRHRREIEAGLRSGEVRAVVATNALELGIDIGGMDAAVLAGYPGSIAATWQQAGRAGRASDTSLAALLTSANPLDQFLAKHPEYFFGRSPEQALVNPDNLLILLGHIRCAAFELPFQKGEPFGGVGAAQVLEFMQLLQQAEVLHESQDTFYWMAEGYPAQEISLRSASTDNVVLHAWQQGDWRVIGEVDSSSAHWMVHPQAIYLHEAQTYLVEDLDLVEHSARLRPTSLDYYTEPRSESTVAVVGETAAEEASGASKSYGDLSITHQVTGFHKIQWYTHERLGLGEVDLPQTELQTSGYWLTLSEGTVEVLRDQGLWSNDPNNYGPNWTAQKKQVRERDGHRCQHCSTPEEGRAHDVHHKIPFRAFDSYETANRLENLITLCPSCHHRAESVVRMRSGLSGLAYTLSHLAPLFLMCDSRDLGMHADPQAPFAEGQPAVALYENIPAGLGFSQRLFELHDELMLRAYELVSGCECTDGCPSCVGPGGELGQGSKKETLALLQNLLLEPEEHKQ